MNKIRVVTAFASLLSAILWLCASALAANGNFQNVRSGFYFESVTLTPSEVEPLFVQSGGDARRFGVSRPTQMTFDENGVAFIAEKEGAVRVITRNAQNQLALQIPAVLDIKTRVNSYADRGLNGIAVRNGWLYIAYTHESGVTLVEGTKTARISRFKLFLNGTQYAADPNGEIVMVGVRDSTSEYPSCNDYPMGAGCIATDSSTHTVGNLNFGPDGYLYAAIGDGADYQGIDYNAFNAQQISSFSGKILRIQHNGSAAPGNPYFNNGRNEYNNASKVWASGLRNPTFFNFNAITGDLIVANVGAGAMEGAYNIRSGDNAGWPCLENGIPMIGFADIADRCPISYNSTSPLREPFLSYRHLPSSDQNVGWDVGAITGVAVPTANEYPDDVKGSVVYADYMLGYLKAARLNSDGSVASTSTLIGNNADSIVGVTTDSAGYLYFFIHELDQRVDGLPLGVLYKVRYNNDPNAPIEPIPAFSATPSPNGALTRVFDASESRDPAGREATYAWSFGDGAQSSGQRVSHTYVRAGTYTAVLTMSAGGVSATATKFVTVVTAGNTTAIPLITSQAIFGVGNQPGADGVYQFPASTNIPILFDVRNDGSAVPYNAVVTIRAVATQESILREVISDQLLSSGASKRHSINPWQTATVGEYTVNIEFYDQASSNPLANQYYSIAKFRVTTRGIGDNNPPVDPNCVDEGNGDSWGVNLTAPNYPGCWLTNNPPDLNVCILGGLDVYFCPDGIAYHADGTPY